MASVAPASASRRRQHSHPDALSWSSLSTRVVEMNQGTEGGWRGGRVRAGTGSEDVLELDHDDPGMANLGPAAWESRS